MKKRVTILSLLFLFFIVMTAPVDLLSSVIEKQNKVQLLGLKGTLWKGQIEQIDYSSWQLRQVEYAIDFFPLLVGDISSHLSIKKGDLRGLLDLTLISQSELQVDHASLDLSASQLQRFIPFPGVTLQGNLATDDLSLVLVNQKLQSISGLTHWTGSKVSIGKSLFDLGNYSAEWRTEPSGKIIGRIIPSNNALSLKGDITLSPQGIFDFKGSVATKIDQRVYNALLFFSSGPAKDGRLPIVFKKKIF